jgi:benzoyl-CoA reductase/2-hydroxyglutaryl-CoA dehydratase subunit BcrC/BadD/HgdB
MTRKEYLMRQKEEKGRKLFGIFPAYYPKEILWAMNVLPVEVWDPPLEVNHANAHLQSYICSVVKLGLELILQGKCRDIDGFLFPHTCDSIQNLASIVSDYLNLDMPCYFFYHPKAPYSDASRRYYLEELKGLVLRLETQLGALDLSTLKQQVKKGDQVTALLKELYRLRACDELTASNTDFYQIIRRGEYLHPDDFLPLLEEFLSASKGHGRKGPSVILSGIVPNPPEILKILDEMGVKVADDDLLNCGRRLLAPESQNEDPFEAMAENYFGMPPCTTKNSSLKARADHLFKKIEGSKAKGVIFYMVKFCETELFDVPHLVEGLKKKGLATLLIDCEVNQGLSGQLETRVEAFVEMIS